MKISDSTLSAYLTILLFISVNFIPPRSELQIINHDLGSDEWHRIDRHDGYVTGNGRMYVVGALGQKLTRNGKSFLTDETVSLTRLSWVIGPHYAVGNLGYGWELEVKVNGKAIGWDDEKNLSPTPVLPFWSVIAENEGLKAELVDVIVEEEPVLLRKLTITRPEDAADVHVFFFLPVHADPRNGSPFQMWNGEPVDGRLSIALDRMLQIDETSESLTPKPDHPDILETSFIVASEPSAQSTKRIVFSVIQE